MIDLKVVELSKERVSDFINYCKTHRSNIDDSFLLDEDLEKFQVNTNNPTYIVTDNNENIVAAASIILDKQSSHKKSRFRVFHSELNDVRIYENLLENILKHTDNLEKIFMFVPIHNKELINNINDLKFKVERYVFILLRELDNIPIFKLPEEYTIKSLELENDEETWCQVRNTAFSTVLGNDTPITSSKVKDMVLSKEYLEGGCMILYHKDKAVGCIGCFLDEHANEPVISIGPLAIIPEYQGRGLGRILLRAGMDFAKNKSYNKTVLCVNADNEKAKSLYIQEGYKEVEGVACYYLDL